MHQPVRSSRPSSLSRPSSPRRARPTSPSRVHQPSQKPTRGIFPSDPQESHQSQRPLLSEVQRSIEREQLGLRNPEPSPQSRALSVATQDARRPVEMLPSGTSTPQHASVAESPISGTSAPQHASVAESPISGTSTPQHASVAESPPSGTSTPKSTIFHF